MKDKQIELVIGSLLHDIGKVVYRTGDGRNHSQSGYEYLKELKPEFDGMILDCVRYHHGTHLKGAKLLTDHPAYLTYFADNIAAAVDRREGMETEDGFDKTVPLASVFNVLNNNNGKQHYAHQVLNPKAPINYPTQNSVSMDEGFYRDVIANISDNLKGITISEEYINSLLSVLEANLSYIPSSTSRREQADISLYDHVKMTAAAAECMFAYLEEKQISNYADFVLSHAADAWKEKMFLLYSMDISGIQNFIYTINSKGALRGLRARSFYLELLMEHIIDELLDALSLSRSCLVYVGGGHCYLLLPNTDRTKNIAEEQQKIVNDWFRKYFDIDLYIACGAAVCSANDLRNEPEGSYSNLYLQISRKISEQKSHRYNAEEIRMLNRGKRRGERECIICRRMERLDDQDRCPICAALENLSKDILYQGYFVVMAEPSKGALPLPNDRYLSAGDKKYLLDWMERDSYIRSYTKNDIYTGKDVATKLWVGNYTSGDTFEEFAQKAEGIKRIAVLRADVDNLGNTFVNGFQREKEGGRYATLSRTATLSRQLSLFFKCYINQLLEDGISNVFSAGGERNVSIVYSGGDDIFLVGAWNEVLDAFLDLRSALRRFTEDTLTISGGVGLYNSGYPINRMAAETAELEDYSKGLENKNAVTVFEEPGRYSWSIFTDQVIGEKFETIRRYFTITNQHGKVFLYHLLELLRESSEKFNRARFVYFLSRMEPERDEAPAEFDAYREFSDKMYLWALEKEDRRQLITAIYLYVYLTREAGEEE